MADEFPPGSIWLVGAGPGDPDLLTVKAARLIAAAEVILHDALVGPGVLALASPAARLVPARLVNVGKRAGRHSLDQAEIGAMLVAAAQAGARVVRLKGGDPSIFGRSGEEIAAAAAAGVPLAICPGVTAASAAAAAARVSLTLRGLARKLTFVTAHARAGEVLALDWDRLADPEATLAIYMGKGSAGTLAAHLLAAGMAGDTPGLLVEEASLPGERLLPTRLDRLGEAAKALGDGPALVLIGAAVAASEFSSTPPA
jgi:uroporphyrin-III C-methyltransferase